MAASTINIQIKVDSRKAKRQIWKMQFKMWLLSLRIKAANFLKGF